MNFKRFTLLSLAVVAAVSVTLLLSSSSESKYFPKDLQKEQASSAKGYLEYMQAIMANPQTGEIDPRDVLKARKMADKLSKNKASLNLNWQFIGPDNIGGRTRALIIDKNNNQHLIAGAVAGGVFESFDGAQSWAPYDPNFSINNISCATQSVDGSFYVGTGGHFEGNGTPKGYFFIGSGVHKLTGNGTFKEIVGPTNRVQPSVDYATIGEIVASPTDNNKLYVAMNNGFRIITMDANSDPVTITDPIGLNLKCNDVDVHPNGNVVVTYNGRIFVSKGSDTSFTETTPPSGGVTWGRIECDIAPSDGNIMYAGIARNNGCLGGIYRSQDAGDTWELIGPGGTSSFDMYANSSQCQGDWDNTVEVFPSNSGKVIVGGVTMQVWEQSSEDPEPSNGSWKQVDVLLDFTANGTRIPNYVHADKHNVAFDPQNPDVAYIASDGGITKSENINDDLPEFRIHNYKYGVTQYYGMDVNGNGIILGGTQDNGSHLLGLKFNNNLGGIEVLGGDGFDAVMSTAKPTIGVAASQNNNLRRIQGVGTTAFNSNISQANIVANNDFLGGLCASAEGCGEVFYSAHSLWESFYHRNSRDSVVLDFISSNLPPILPGHIFGFKSKNSNLTQFDTLGVSFGNTVSSDSLYPIDTILNEFSNDLTYSYSEITPNGVVVNFDTILIDTANKTITINKINANNETISFSDYDTTLHYSNYFVDYYYGSGNEDVDIYIGNVNDEVIVTIENHKVQFIYQHKVQDRVQSIFATANWAGKAADRTEFNIFITRDLLKVKSDIVWHQVAGPQSSPDPINSPVMDMAFSSDGSMMFIGTYSGELYRLDDLDSVTVDLQPTTNNNYYRLNNTVLAGNCHKIGSFSQAVTDIAVDPNDPNYVVVALGNYGTGSQSHIARTTVGATTFDDIGTFQRIQGNGTDSLPLAPAYSVLIDRTDRNKILVGTELGLFATDNGFASNPNDVSWTEENTGLGRVPVFEIRQMTFNYANINKSVLDSLDKLRAGAPIVIDGKVINDKSKIDSVINRFGEGLIPIENEGVIYIGTHGRGVYKTDQLVGLDKFANKPGLQDPALRESLKVFPNPATSITNISFKSINDSSPMNIEVFNLQGQLIYEERRQSQTNSEQLVKVNVDDLDNGTYIVRIRQADQMASTKFIKY